MSPRRPEAKRFAYSQDALRTIAADVLAAAREAGATACEMSVSEGYGQVVTVRMGAVETIEHNRDKDVGVTIYVGQRSGYASTSDFSPKALRDTVHAALTIAKYTAEDEANGLADPALLARDVRDLDLFHPWDVTPERAIEIACEAEAAAFRLDKRITNSDGASVSSQQSQFVAANSAGFMAGQASSRHYISCSVIAAEGDAMQRDDWYSLARSSRGLAKPEAIGDYAGRRALARLRSRRLKTRKAPVLFEAPMAHGLLGHFVSAVSGTNLYRKSSFLIDSAGQQVFAPFIQLREEPHLKNGLASSYFDDDGVATKARDGVVQGYFLGVYSARKLGLATTGNAGGPHNLILAHGRDDLEAMLRRLGTGLFVTDLMGQGVNMVTGDYSRGASGYWVERGEIQYPVEEITIAANLRDMFKNIVAVGGDVLERGGRSTGSILVDGMTIAGS
jgi:PmbA protein